MFNFVQVQERRNIYPQEYIEYFEDLPASGGLNFESDAEIGRKGAFFKGFDAIINGKEVSS